MVVRRKVGRETFEVVRTHVVDVTELAEELRAEGRDKYTYGAPALLVFHADPREVAAENNAHIVATYAMLAAHALGLGATWMDLITPVVNREPRAAEVLGLPRGNVAYASLIVGHPQIRYRRAIDRSLKGVAYV